MSKYSNTINFNLRTTLDSSGLNQLQAQLNKVNSELTAMSKKNIINDDEFKKASSQITKLQQALSKSFKSDLGIFDIKSLQKELNGLNLSQLEKTMSTIPGGTQAFSTMLGQVSKIDNSFRSISNLTDKIFNTMGNTVRWGITASIFQSIQNSLYQAVDYVKELDTSLNNIRIVTNASNSDMRDFALYANEAAQAVGASTTSFTNAAQLYAQNGFSEEDYTRLATITQKVANVTQQDTATVSEQITALMEGYHMSIDQVEESLGGMSVVAAASAADLEELATAEQKVASTANTLGVSHEQLTAQIGTIVSVTRQAPESVGNALRTLYARIADLQMGETLEDGTTLGNLSGTLADIGINVTDAEGNLRNLGDVLEELQGKWGDLSNAQQIALGTKLAGKYQLNPFMALMENADMYQEQLEMMQTSAGALDEQNAIYMDSMAAKLQQLSTAGEGLITHLFNPDDIKPFIENLTSIVNLVTEFVDAIGGANNILGILGSTAVRVFSKQMVGGISTVIQNMSKVKTQKSNQDILMSLGYSSDEVNDTSKTAVGRFVSSTSNIRGGLTEQGAEQYNSVIEMLQRADAMQADADRQLQEALQAREEIIKEQREKIQQAYPEENILNEKGEVTEGYKKGADKRNATRQSNVQLSENALNALEAINSSGAAGAVNKIKQAESEIRDLQKALASVNPSKAEDLNEALEDINTAPDKTSQEEALERIKKLLQSVSNEAKRANQELDDRDKAVQNATDAVAAAENGVTSAQNNKNNTDQQVKDAEDLGQKTAKNIYYEGLASSMVAAAGAAGQLIMAFTTLGQIQMIWDDTNLTQAEKFRQTLMLLAMDLPMIASGIQGITTGFTAAKEAVANGIMALVKYAAQGDAVALKGVANWAAQIAGVEGLTVATEGATGATIGLGTALKVAAPQIALITAAIAAVVAVGAVVVDYYNELNKYNEAAEKAADTAADVAQAATNIKNNYEELESNINAYNDANESLKTLKQGTQEWSDALSEVNNQVINLLENYPELAKYVYTDSTGAMHITEEGLEELQQEQQEDVASSQLASHAATAASRNAELDAQQNELLSNIYGSSHMETYVNGPFESEQRKYDSLTEEQLNKLENLYDEQGAEALYDKDLLKETLGLSDEEADYIVKSITDSADKLISFFESEDAAQESKEVTGTADMLELLKAQEGFDASDPNAQYTAQMLAEQAQEGGQYYEEAEKKYSGMDAAQIAQSYLSDVGGSSYELKDGNIIIKDEQGNEVQNMSEDAMRQMLTAMEAANAAAENWREVGNLANHMQQSELGQMANGTGASILMNHEFGGSTDFSGFSESELAELDAEVRKTGTLDIQKLAGLTDAEYEQIWRDAGADSGEAFAQSLANQFQEYMNNHGSYFDAKNIDASMEAIDDAFSYDSGEIDAWLKGNNRTQEDFEAARQYVVDNTGDEGGEFSIDYKNQQAYVDELEAQIEAAREAGKSTSMLEQELVSAQKAMANYNQMADDMATATLQTQKGLEDLGQVLTDDVITSLTAGEKAGANYAENLEAVRNATGNVLNIDAGNLSEEFLTSADNLELMKKAAQGDVEALEQLRLLAGQDIIANMHIEGVSDEERTKLTGELANLAAQLPDVEVGADIDDTAFVQKLNKMMQDGNITAETVNAILSSMGYDVEVGYQPIEFPRVEYPGFNGDLLRGAAGIINPIMEKVSTKFPVIHAVKRGTTGGFSLPSGGNAPGDTSGPGGSGGGGGGGGGGGKSYTPKTKDPIEDALDRYERVNAELDTLANQYEAVADEQERLAGFDVADNMSKQIGLIKEQIKWEQEKLKIQKDEAQEYRDQLASQYGITYDAEGHITNYANVYKKLLNNLNGLIDKYNATTTESGQEALDKQIEDAQENFDKFSELVENYDELVSNSILETEKEIQDFYDQIEDLQIEAFQKAVDSVDNIKDLQESIIDFNAIFTGLDSDSPFRSMITALDNLKTYWDVNTVAVDDYYDELIKRNNEAMKNASATQKENLKYQNAVLEAAREQYGKGTFEAGGTGLFDMTMANLNTILEQMKQIEETGTSTIFGENAGSMYEVGNDIFDQAVSLLEDYEGHLDDLRDSIIDAIDEIGDKMDERLETYENINDELEHYADIIEMVQGENAYSQLNQVSQATITNNQAAINELKQNIALWQDMLAAMEEGSEEWKTVNEYITDAQQELLEKTSDTVEEMLDMYERGVNDILDKWIGSTGMGDDLDWIAEEWELINRNADYYLDDVNAAYEIQKLQGKYLDLLDNANGLDVQNQITQQMAQQLAYLREKDKLSEYDVQYANAQLEILQKTIALQEAQRNKSQLQLRRDNQGNYSYVYTADENDTRAAQNDLLDAQNNAYNLSKDQMKQTQDDSLSALQDARDTLEQIWTNANLTLEEKTKRTQTIIDSLKEYLVGTSEQLSESEKNIINDFLGMCEILTEENDERLQDVYEQIVNGNKDAFDQIDTRWQTSITNWLQNMEEFNAATDESFQGLIDNFEDYQGQLDELGDLAGMTFDDMSDSIQNAVDKTNDLASSTSSFISQLKNDAGTVKEYEAALAEMTAKIQDAENGMRAYQEQVNQLQQNLTAKEQENANLTSQVQDLQSQIDAMKNPGGSGGGGGGGGASSELAWGIAQAIWTYGGASGWGNDPIRSSKLTKAYGSAFAKQVQSIINQNYRSNKLVNYDSMKYSSYKLIGYDTGGYTGGDWTASEKANGKIGLLHEKELVLNKTDTENILNAVDMVRSMVALGRNGNYNDIIRQSNNVVDMASVVQPLDDMGQNIYQVECTFPNATNVDEIQRAILTLPDIAPQYAYKS